MRSLESTAASTLSFQVSQRDRKGRRAPTRKGDPANPNYIYHLITRYTGPKPCGTCNLPAIVLRCSTDGGATWLPDQFLALTSKGQYDPQIEVSNNGNVYAVWLDAFTPGRRRLLDLDPGRPVA